MFCKDCKFWDRYSLYVYRDPANEAESKMTPKQLFSRMVWGRDGSCDNVKVGILGDNYDGIDTERGGDTGENFGCIHFEQSIEPELELSTDNYRVCLRESEVEGYLNPKPTL